MNTNTSFNSINICWSELIAIKVLQLGQNIVPSPILYKKQIFIMT